MNIAIGADHRGFTLKNGIKELVVSMSDNQSIQWIDVGCFSDQYCDYPIFAQHVVQTMRNGQADLGVLLCGTGVGMAIAANRFAGIYAALVWAQELARMARAHDNANILVLPSDYLTLEQSTAIIHTWLETKFEGGRHQRRIDQIDLLGGI